MLFQINSMWQILGWVLVFAGLIITNEIERRTKKGGIFFFGIVLAALTVYFIAIQIGAHTGAAWALNSQTYKYMNGWFHYAKLYAAVAGCIGFMLLKYKTGKIEKKHLIPKWNFVSKIISLGAAPCFNQLAMMIVQIVMNKSLTYYGALSVYGESIPLACAGIITKVNQIYMSIVIGLSQGLQPIVSFNYGAKLYDRVKKAYTTAISYGLGVSVVAFLAFQFLPRQIVSIFGSGSEVYYTFAVKYFRIFLFFTFLNCLQPISSNFFTAIGKPKKGIFLSLTRQILFLLPLIVVLPLFIGIDGIMYSGPIADFIAGTVSILMIYVEFKNIGTKRVSQKKIV